MVLIFQMLTGIGTILFHGTLLYIFQMIDEIPMILLCSEYIKLLKVIYDKYNDKYNDNYNDKYNDNYFYKKTIKFNSSLNMIILIFGLGYINDWIQVQLFQIYITVMVLYLLSILYYIDSYESLLLKKLIKTKCELQEELLSYYKVSVKLSVLKSNIKYINMLNKNLKYYKKIFYICGLSSIIVWKFDNIFCEYINMNNIYFNGHAIWHILTSILLYYVNMIILMHFRISDWYDSVNFVSV